MAPKPEPHRLAFVARDVQVRVITGLLGFGIGLAMVRTILTIPAWTGLDSAPNPPTETIYGPQHLILY